jgi:tetratricopeptide (TPR) repeat protein
VVRFPLEVFHAICRIVVLSLLPVYLSAADWSLARSSHFEVYAQGHPETARALLLWFEQLRGYFAQQPNLNVGERRPVRVVAFASLREYEPYRLSPAADAYHVQAGNQDFIVTGNPADLRIAAHEYWHVIEDASGLRLPPWLSEGLAEYFSFLRIGRQGGDSIWEIRSRYRALRMNPWIPLPKLLTLSAELRDSGQTSALFYAQSWALAAMLAESPGYSARFEALLAAVASGLAGEQALLRTYDKGLEQIARDLHAWVGNRGFTPVTAPNPDVTIADLAASIVSPFAPRFVLAQVLMATGKTGRAGAIFEELAQEAPDNPDVAAALALIALHKGDIPAARQRWNQALEHGIPDASTCYRYAVLGQNAGMSPEEIRPALERAVALEPSFDDALYTLALLENNASQYESAVQHLHAMHLVAVGRQFAYWIATAEALKQLGRREEAKAAATRAAAFATTPEQRAQAAELGVMAATDLAVQFTRDDTGQSHLVTTRAPHGGPEWNPFIEPGDVIRRVEGKLREIQCNGSVTTFLVETATGLLPLVLTDPGHVSMRNAPAEFTCGPQADTAVLAVYAASGADGGVLRSLEFR